jgi:abequosyltransferase
MSTPPLLSICIPTFNRSTFLQLCLTQFCKQIEAGDSTMEIIVGDNDSTDETAEIVAKFIQNGYPINYFKNDNNIGADGNVAACITKSCGEYFWVFGDDDLLLDDQLGKITKLLSTKQFGHIYLGNYWFVDDWKKEMPTNSKFEQSIYTDKEKYLRQINIWTTFISAHIMHRSVLKDITIQTFIGSNLNQLQWILPAMFQTKPSINLKGNIIACKGNNTGGYSLFQTFGSNLNKVVDYLTEKKLIPFSSKKILNYYFIKDFMPIYCIRYKQKQLVGFEKEQSPFVLLEPFYKNQLIYWLVMKPIDWLPVFFGKKYYFGLKKIKLI